MTTAFSRSPSAEPSAGTATWPSDSRRTATRSPISPFASGRTLTRGVPGVSVRAVGPRSMPYTRPAAPHPAGRGVRCGGVPAPPPPRPPLRRGTHRVVSLLLAARRCRGSRSVQVLVVDWHEVWSAATGASTWAGWDPWDTRYSGFARACRSGPSAFPVSTPTACEARASTASPPFSKASTTVRSSSCPRARGGRSGLRWTAHPGETGARSGGRYAGVPRPGPRASSRLYGDGPERQDVERRVAELGLTRTVRAHGFVAAQASRGRSAGRSAWCFRPVARAMA